MAPTPSPGDIRAIARDDMINTMMIVLEDVQKNGLLTVPDHHLRTAAAQVFDKLSHHVTMKVLAGMAMPQGNPT